MFLTIWKYVTQMFFMSFFTTYKDFFFKRVFEYQQVTYPKIVNESSIEEYQHDTLARQFNWARGPPVL